MSKGSKGKQGGQPPKVDLNKKPQKPVQDPPKSPGKKSDRPVKPKASAPPAKELERTIFLYITVLPVVIIAASVFFYQFTTNTYDNIEFVPKVQLEYERVCERLDPAVLRETEAETFCSYPKLYEEIYTNQQLILECDGDAGTYSKFFLYEAPYPRQPGEIVRYWSASEGNEQSTIWQSLMHIKFKGTDDAPIPYQAWPAAGQAFEPHVFSYARFILTAMLTFPSRLDCKDQKIQPSVLVLGLGGGTIPSFINHYFPKWRVDVVELSHCLVEHTKDSGLPENSNNFRVFLKDAADFVAQECTIHNQYNWIIVDMAVNDGSAPVVYEDWFLETLSTQCLAPFGTVLFNIMGDISDQIKDHLLQISNFFTHLHVIPAGYWNRILVVFNHDYVPTTSSLIGRAQKLPQECNLPLMLKGIQYQYPLDFSTPKTTQQALDSLSVDAPREKFIPSCDGIANQIYV